MLIQIKFGKTILCHKVLTAAGAAPSLLTFFYIMKIRKREHSHLLVSWDGRERTSKVAKDVSLAKGIGISQSSKRQKLKACSTSPTFFLNNIAT